MQRKWWATVGLVVLLCAWRVPAVAAQNVGVKIGVGDTILKVSGQTSPNAFVVISRDGDVIGTTISTGNGLYTQTFPAQEPDLHTISVFSQTPAGIATDVITNTVNIMEHATTSVQVFLPPTIVIVNERPELNQPIHIQGEAFPYSSIVLYLDNTAYIAVGSDGNGVWQATIETKPLRPGRHRLFVRAVDAFSQLSYPSSSRPFQVQWPPGPPPKPVPPVPGIAPPMPAIVFPKNNDIWRQSTITIRGIGQPGAQIEIWDGDNNIGSTWVDNNGEWSIELRLLPKEYQLKVRACRDGTCSDFSEIHTFQYLPDGASTALDEPLYIIVSHSAFNVYLDEEVILSAEIINGQPPYALNIDWGDGNHQDIQYSNQHLAPTHQYSKAGKYTVQLDVRDSQGRTGRITVTVHVQTLEAVIWRRIALGISLLFMAGASFYLFKKRFPYISA